MRCSRNIAFILGLALLIFGLGYVTAQAQRRGLRGIKNPEKKPPTSPKQPTKPRTGLKLSDSSGPQTGGNRVTITGAAFSDQTKVTFGQVPAEIIKPVQPETITVVVPRRDRIGFVDVVISTPGKKPLRARYQYKIPPPSAPAAALGIMRVEPNTAFPNKENAFKIIGRGLTSDTRVSIEGQPFTAEVGDTGQLIIVVPPNRFGLGPRDIVVTNPDNSQFTMVDGITFVGPKIFSIEPSRGPTAGGQQVRIRGLYLKVNNPADVVFGDKGATNGKPDDTNEHAISVDTPPHLPGWVDVVIHNAHGQKTTLSKAYYYEEERGPSAPPIKYSRLGFNLRRIDVLEDGAAGKGNLWSFDISVNGKPLCNLDSRTYKVGIQSMDTPAYHRCWREIDIEDQEELRVRIIGTRGEVWMEGEKPMAPSADMPHNVPIEVEVSVEGNDRMKGFFRFFLGVVKLIK